MTAPPTTATADLSLVERWQEWSEKATAHIRTLEAEKRAAEERAEKAEADLVTVTSDMAGAIAKACDGRIAAEAETAALRAERDEARALADAQISGHRLTAANDTRHLIERNEARAAWSQAVERGNRLFSELAAAEARVARLTERAEKAEARLENAENEASGHWEAAVSLTERVGKLEGVMRVIAHDLNNQLRRKGPFEETVLLSIWGRIRTALAGPATNMIAGSGALAGTGEG